MAAGLDNLLAEISDNRYTCFKSNSDMYEQTKGTPMGSPTSGFLDEAVTLALENIALPRIQPKRWVRYVEDAFVIIKPSNNQQRIQRYQPCHGIGER